MHDLFKHRRSGILLHPSSLPGTQTSGKLNQEALNFVDFLAAAGVTVWQILPIGPTHDDGSPYQSYSSHALNPSLLDLSIISHWKCLPPEQLEHCLNSKTPLTEVFQSFHRHADGHHRKLFGDFRETQRWWLDDYSLYRILKEQHAQLPWTEWDEALRDRHPAALEPLKRQESAQIELIEFEQFILYTAWQQIKNHAALKNVMIFGDVPIFVSHDSADVWANRELFDLDEAGYPHHVAGVPPDYFSETGQRWGNPLYRWDAMEKDGYDWWIKRIRHQLSLCDLLRIDHFRGLEAYWEIPATEQTAMNGKWVKAPGEALLAIFKEHFNGMPFVAEDLGIITPEVDALREAFHLPGMKILQFAFDSDALNPYLPHNHEQRSVIYTGTHDNDTTLGWYEGLDPGIRERCMQYLNHPADPMPWPVIQSALASVAALAIIPMQDILELGSEGRMNTPGTTEGNWAWQFQWSQVDEALANRLHSLNSLYGRTIETWRFTSSS